MAIDMEGAEPFDEFLIGEIRDVVRDLNKSLLTLKENVPLPQQKLFEYTGLSLRWLEALATDQNTNTQNGKQYFNINSLIQEMFERWVLVSDGSLSLKTQIENESISHIYKVRFMRLLDLVYKKFSRNQGGNASLISVWFDANEAINICFKNEDTATKPGLSEARTKWVERDDNDAEHAQLFEDKAINHLLNALKGQINVTDDSGQFVTMSFAASQLMHPNGDANSAVSNDKLDGILISKHADRIAQMENKFNDSSNRLKVFTNSSDAIKIFKTRGVDFIIVDCMDEINAISKTVKRLRAARDLDANVPILLLGTQGELDLIKIADKLLYDDILILPLDGAVSARNKINITRQKRREKTANLGGRAGGHMTLNSDRLVIDSEVLSGLKSAVGPEVFNELLLKLHADLMIVRAELKSASRDLDLFQIRRSTHVLISLAGSFGASDLHLLAQKLNILSNQEKREEVVVYLQDCIRGLDLFIGFVVEEQSL